MYICEGEGTCCIDGPAFKLSTATSGAYDVICNPSNYIISSEQFYEVVCLRWTTWQGIAQIQVLGIGRKDRRRENLLVDPVTQMPSAENNRMDCMRS